MEIVNFKSDAGPWQAGVTHEDTIIALTVGAPGTPITVKDLLEAGPKTLRRVVDVAITRAEPQRRLPRDSVLLGPPVPNPSKILGVGLNYREHAKEAGLEPPTSPILFAKFANSLVGPTDEIVLPRVSAQVDYGGELAFVIGQRCKDVAQSAALKCVAGYTVANDVSARDLQLRTSQWTAGKAIDTFAPMGPGLVPAWEVPDPQDLMLTTKLNGEIVQSASTADMIFSVADTIVEVSALMTLEPGDVILTGTPSGVGSSRTPPVWLSDGDVVEVEISQIGVLRNRVVRPER